MDQTASVDSELIRQRPIYRKLIIPPVPNPTFLPQKHTGPPHHPPNVTLDLPLLGMGASTTTDRARVALEEASWSDRTILDLYPDVTWTKYCASRYGSLAHHCYSGTETIFLDSVGKKVITRIHAETKMYQGTVEGKKEAITGAKEKSNFSASFLFPPRLFQNRICRICLLCCKSRTYSLWFPSSSDLNNPSGMDALPNRVF